MNARNRFPALPFEAWEDAKITLHLFTQIVGKVKLGMCPPVNHWWHIPYYVSPRGLTSGAFPHGGRSLELEFDFLDHRFTVRTSEDPSWSLPLPGTSVARFYRDLMGHLRALGLGIDILARPFDPEKVGSAVPFAGDDEHAAYDPEAVQRFWRVLIGVEHIFRIFRARYLGKCSPIHFFWHSFDLAVTRFSGRPAKVSEDADPVTREAYSHEVISAGFWPGDHNMPEPAFYAYAAPEPEGLGEQALRPAAAWWEGMNGGAMALYRYEDLRQSTDPESDLLGFLQSSYEAGAGLAGWPRAELERGGPPGM